MPFQPKVSIVINTDGRAKPLALCLESLRYLRYPNFEVVVVAGPTRDGTHELCESWGDAIKYGRCPVRNLSQSRNIGIAMASGDIVAYIDDDAVPEPEWLDDIVAAFEDERVGVAGGFLHDHTGKTYQWKYGTVDRFGGADTTWTRPTPEFNFPGSFHTPQVIGANSVFRRSALLHIGGFDEEYEYFLDETDVTTRIIDAGWTVAQLDRAFVHHKFAPSDIRNHAKLLTSWYSVVKNKAYFSILYGSNYAGIDAILDSMHRNITSFRWTVHWAVGEKLMNPADIDRFEDEASRGLRDGLARGFSGQRRLPPKGFLENPPPFAPFRTLLPAAQQRCFIFLSHAYPPDGGGGIARFTHQLARSVARLGHQVHVLTAGSGHDRVDFEEGVWVHRITVKSHPAPTSPELAGIPQHMWDYSRTMLDEAEEIASRRKVDAVEAPIWDVEGAAFVGHPTLPLVTSLHTTLKSYLDSNAHLKADEAYMASFARPVLRIERLLLERPDGIHANSRAIVEEIESAYEIKLDRDKMRIVPHGLEDWAGPAADAPLAHEGPVRVYFIGRLELRKGVDVVMEIAPELLRRHPDVRLEFFGNDKVPAAPGETWRERFEARADFAQLRERIVFHGEVSDDRLRQAYAEADIVLAPSRFESFGLVHLEAQMYGKPVVGGRIGGMVEVIDDGVTGLLAQPADAASLLAALERLVGDARLRASMGRAARQRYLEHFTAERMAGAVVDMFSRLPVKVAPVSLAPATASPVQPPYARWLPQARSLNSPLRVVVVGSVLAPFDAISNDIVRHARFLREAGYAVDVRCWSNERSDIEALAIPTTTELLLDPAFRAADVIVWHFGIYYPLFDALCVGNGHARQAVVFHNITPLAHVPESARDVIEKSFAQLANLRMADALWADSRENAEVLIAEGFDPAKITIQPLAVDRPQRRSLRSKPRSDVLQLIFIGRIVPSKGLQDLVEALPMLDAGLRVQVKVVGDIERAEPAFRDALRRRIAELGLEGRIEFTGTLSDDERDALLASSHILLAPSYHEGFCVPVIEALRAALLPVVYFAHNLRYIADGLCVSSPPGDVAAFARALSRASADVHAALANPHEASLRLDRGVLTVEQFETAVARHVDGFEPAAVAKRLSALVDGLAASEPAATPA